jgi:ACS family tartrate transporter-like MFS transporter
VPSNLALAKVGARKWISRIMISWGIISACMAFVQGPTGFIVVRLLLGAAEAGFFRGVILYLTFWFPQEYRARIVAAFIVAVPVSLALGRPLSTGFLSMDGIARSARVAVVVYAPGSADVSIRIRLFGSDAR